MSKVIVLPKKRIGCEMNVPPAKRQKITENGNDDSMAHHSRIKVVFSETYDQEQFEMLFTVLNEYLNIPTCINQKIAAFATGDVTYCDNEKCDLKVVMLYEDFEKETDNKYYRVSNSGDLVWCEECMSNTEVCSCG
eukprot:457489_1